MAKTQLNATALLDKASRNLRIDSAWLTMNSQDAAEAENPLAAQVLYDAAIKVGRLASTFERLKREFERSRAVEA
jgi:hypothetical protein